MLLHEKVAVVTGGANGIGREICLALAEEGATVAIIDIAEASEALALLAGHGTQAIALQVDITDYQAVTEATGQILARFGRIDILVNNAGIIARGTLLDLSVETWKHVMDVNVNGTFYWCKAVLPVMLKQRQGRIVNITSIAAKTGDLTAAPVYGTSKGAVTTLTRSLARQVSDQGITVNAVAPHAIETDMSAAWSEEKRREVILSLPVKRMGSAREVAAAVCFLVGPDAGFITGETLNVNGGYLMD